MNMKNLLISVLATALVATFAISAEAAGNKHKVSADVQASSSSSQEIFRHPFHEAAELRERLRSPARQGKRSQGQVNDHWPSAKASSVS